MSRLRLIGFVGLVSLIGLISPAFAASDFPAATSLLVNDFAGVFTLSQVREMEVRLETFSDTTSNQICVVTMNDLMGYEPADYAQRLGQKWGVGSAKDNGVLILLKPRTEAEKYIDVFIATGYGIEGALPDALCKRIINNQMAPFLRQDPPDYYGAVEAAVSQIEPIMLGEYNDGADSDEEELTTGELIVFIFIIVLILLMFRTNHRRRGGGGHLFGSGSGSNSGYSSGSSGSFGGFSSGGSSFGGFGGGSFGGGGAGGRF